MDLPGLAHLTIDNCIERLREGSFVRVMATVFSEDEVHVFLDNGDLPEDAFLTILREKVKELNAEAVCFVADTFFTQVTSPEAHHRINRGETFSPAEIVARKWGRRREAIMCTVEAPGQVAIYAQFYRRNGEGAIILEERNATGQDFAGTFRFFKHEPTVQ